MKHIHPHMSETESDAESNTARYAQHFKQVEDSMVYFSLN